MIPKRTVRCAAAAAAVVLATACSKDSTGPGDPLVGTWNVTVQDLIYNGNVVPDTGTVTPAPFQLQVGKSGTTYTATVPVLTWNVTISGSVLHLPLQQAQAADTVMISGDTVRVRIPSATMVAAIGTGCEVAVTGVFLPGGAQGSIEIAGGACGTIGGAEAATGTFTATKQ